MAHNSREKRKVRQVLDEIGRREATTLIRNCIAYRGLAWALRERLSAEKFEIIMEEADTSKNRIYFLLRELEFIVTREEFNNIQRCIETCLNGILSKNKNKLN